MPPPAPSPITVDGEIAQVHLGGGRVAIIDAVDISLVEAHRWRAWYAKRTGTYYALTSRNNLTMHVLLMQPPTGSTVDHANHDTLDNRRSNLRLATYGQNNRNRRMPRSNTSGYLGVRCARPGRYEAVVRGVRLGSYPTAEAAAHARDQHIRDHLDAAFWTYNFPANSGERAARPME